MRFGFFLPLSGALASIPNVVQGAEAAESLGYDSVWVQDRSLTQTRENYLNHLVCGSVEDIDRLGDPNFLEPLTMLAALAVKTRSIRLGTSVLQLPVYDPLVLAKQAASIDALSGGRLNMGVGIGTGITYARRGFENIHIPFSKRGAIFDEYASAIRILLSSKSPSSFDGKYVQFSNLELFPKPVSLKLLVGSGVAPKGLRRIVEYGDGVIIPYRTPPESLVTTSTIREALQRSGRNENGFVMAQTVYACIGKTTEDARALLAPTIALRARGFAGKSMSTDVHAGASKRGVSDKDFFEMSLVGTRRDIIDQIERYHEAGVDELVMVLVFRGKNVDALLDTSKTFANEVMHSF